MVHDPLSPSEALRTTTGSVLGVVGLLVFAYSVLIVGQVLLGAIAVGGLVGLYLTYHSLTILDSIADAAQRFAAAKEREVESTEPPADADDIESSADPVFAGSEERD